MTKHEQLANELAAAAHAEIKIMARRATESMNRSIGQIARHTAYRFDLARRGVSL